jgi:hypothetical protein
MPFCIWGVFHLVLLIDTLLKVRKGYIKVWKLLPNDQIVKFWSRPSGGKIKIKSKGSVTGENDLPIELGKGWIWREGGVPIIKLDKDNKQIKWEVNVIEAGIPKEVIDELADTSFVAGMLVGFKQGKELKRIQLLLVILAIMIVMAMFLNYYQIANIKIVTQVVNVVATNVTQTPIV